MSKKYKGKPSREWSPDDYQRENMTCIRVPKRMAAGMLAQAKRQSWMEYAKTPEQCDEMLKKHGYKRILVLRHEAILLSRLLAHGYRITPQNTRHPYRIMVIKDNQKDKRQHMKKPLSIDKVEEMEISAGNTEWQELGD